MKGLLYKEIKAYKVSFFCEECTPPVRKYGYFLYFPEAARVMISLPSSTIVTICLYKKDGKYYRNKERKKEIKLKKFAPEMKR